ncbi:hypothetical protein [Psychromicrobium sp. YIM B11713]|uniref:hypothetical protein n=1 Tax=Psychromicrobium sp. YIM B11713 TaxID=3145233 RepID=UPI00374F3D05
MNYLISKNNRLFSTVFGLVLLVAGSLFVAPTANAAPSCYFESCTNKDPQNSGCSVGAYTIGYAWGVEIRFSPNCGASWLRPVVQVGSLSAQVKVTLPNNVYDYRWYGVGGYYGNEPWTRMSPLQPGGMINWWQNGDKAQTGWFDTKPA